MFKCCQFKFISEKLEFELIQINLDLHSAIQLSELDIDRLVSCLVVWFISFMRFNL